MNKSEIEAALSKTAFTGSWAGTIRDPGGDFRNVASSTVFRDEQFGNVRCIGQSGHDETWQALQVMLAPGTPDGRYVVGDGHLLQMAYIAPGQSDVEIAVAGAVSFSRGKEVLYTLRVQDFLSGNGTQIDCNLIIEGELE